MTAEHRSSPEDVPTDDSLDATIRALRAQYETAVDKLAAQIAAEYRAALDAGTAEDLAQLVDEAVRKSPWLSCTQLAQVVLLCSDNDAAYASDFGELPAVRGGKPAWSALAHAALRADLYDRLPDDVESYTGRAIR